MNIEITLKNYRCFTDSEPAKIIIDDGWSSLIGINNSGKSSIAKSLYELKTLFYHLGSLDELSQAIIAGRITGNLNSNVKDFDEVLNRHNTRNATCTFRIFEPNKRTLTFELLLSREDKCVGFSSINKVNLHVGTRDDRSYGHNGRHIMVNDSPINDSDRLPGIFRILRRVFYIGAYRNILNTGAKENYFDIDIGTAFVRKWKRMQTGNSIKDNESVQRVIQSIERLLGISRLDIQASDDDTALKVIIDRKSYKLQELGSGIAQFILVLGSVAVAQPSFILIDEPELNLHPTLQLDFLSELAKYAEHGILFSTHSIGLARATADRIFTVQRIADGHSRVVPFEQVHNMSELLGALSYSNYQAIGFDKVLLVEGVHEVRTIQQLLRKLKKDHKILLLPLGGSQMITSGRDMELSELKRITPNISAIIDSERSTESEPIDHERINFATSCQALNIPCHTLMRRALENYFTTAAIQNIKGDKYRALTPFEKLSDTQYGWSKTDNWRIAGEMVWDDIAGTDLGQFLESL
jgi:energy-coupling factor transporter ATP-binding protein EcfA2